MTSAAVPLPAPDPEITEETRQFWSATSNGELHLPQCNACGAVIWYPRLICPECHGREVSWVPASGRGAVYTYTVAYRSLGEFATAVPYVIAYVELDEGPRILTNIVECDPGKVAIGARVELHTVPTPGGAALHRFRLAR